jgi:hypothetical protein
VRARYAQVAFLFKVRFWRNADIRQIARVSYGGNNRRRTGLIAAIADGVVGVFEGQADAFRC